MHNRDRTKLVQGMGWQVEAVRQAMDRCCGHRELPLRAVLCFVDSEWPRFFAKPIQLSGVTILWPRALQDLVRSGDVLDADGVDRVARDLAAALPAKSPSR